MWRVMYLDFEHPHMWLAFEYEGKSYWNNKAHALEVVRICERLYPGKFPGAHVVYEPQRASA